jgi:hypothetical protein
MKINNDYIKKVLIAIEAQEAPRPYLDDILQTLGLEDATDEFLLHYEVLLDDKLIEAPTSDDRGIKHASSGELYYSDIPIRLTAKGHELIEALNKSEIWDVIKTEFKESSVKTIFKVGRNLAEGYAKKRVEDILDEKT